MNKILKLIEGSVEDILVAITLIEKDFEDPLEFFRTYGKIWNAGEANSKYGIKHAIYKTVSIDRGGTAIETEKLIYWDYTTTDANIKNIFAGFPKNEYNLGWLNDNKEAIKI